MSYCSQLENFLKEILNDLLDRYNYDDIREAKDIGDLLITLKEVEQYNPVKWIIKDDITHTDNIFLWDSLEDELSDVEKYYNEFLAMKDMNYKNIARQELAHADILLKKLRSATTDQKSLSDLQKYTDCYNMYLQKLSVP